MRQDTILKILDSLNRMYKNKDGMRVDSVGICFNLCSLLESETQELIRLMNKWPEASGNASFPVPHNKFNPMEAYFRSKPNLWNKRTKYGRARFRLCKWLIEELEKQLDGKESTERVRKKVQRTGRSNKKVKE